MITIYSKMLENKFVFDAFVSTFKNKQIVHFYYQHFVIYSFNVRVHALA